MSIRVLIADDHAVFRSGLRALLEKEQDLVVVGETGDGRETVRTATHEKIDVLLLDISMPGLPGPQVAEAVLNERPRLAIVVLTMHEDDYYLQEMFRIGVRGFVLKKSTGTDLIQAIRTVFRGDQYVDPALGGRVISSFVGRNPQHQIGRANLLTPREREVCILLAYGHTNVEVAQKLSISERTVESHRTHLMAKLDLKSRAELVRFAIDNGLLKMT
jgi:DNA-binding NarL/FixJ family response regulator